MNFLYKIMSKEKKIKDIKPLEDNTSIKQWDKYFLSICNAISLNSKCLSRQLGAILVRDNIVISTGYNSPPRKIPDCKIRCQEDNTLHKLILTTSKINTPDLNFKPKCPRKLLNFKSGEGLEYCPSIHAEKNCIISSARNGICTKDATLYLNAEITPCSQCFGAIINAGIKEVVLKKITNYDITVKYIIKNSNIKLREFIND